MIHKYFCHNFCHKNFLITFFFITHFSHNIFLSQFVMIINMFVTICVVTFFSQYLCHIFYPYNFLPNFYSSLFFVIIFVIFFTIFSKFVLHNYVFITFLVKRIVILFYCHKFVCHIFCKQFWSQFFTISCRNFLNHNFFQHQFL